MNFWHKWRFHILGGTVALLVAGYTAFWFAAAHIARNTLDGMIAAQRAAGFDITYAELTTGGFPFQVELEFKDLKLGKANAFEPWLASAPKVQIIALPWDPDHVVIFAESPRFQKDMGKLHLPDGSERPIALVGQGKLLKASQVALEGRWQATDIVLEQVTLGGLKRPDWVVIGNLELHSRNLPEPPPNLTAAPLAELAILVEHIKANPLLGPFISQEVPRLTATARYRGDHLPGGFGKSDVLAWRDQGGMIDITQLHLNWGLVTADLKGSLALDSASRPLADLQAEIGNHGELVKGLQKAGVLSPQTAGQLQSVLDQMVSINGGPDRRLRTNITLGQGQMFVGPVLAAEIVPPLFNDNANPSLAAASN